MSRRTLTIALVALLAVVGVAVTVLLLTTSGAEAPPIIAAPDAAPEAADAKTGAKDAAKERADEGGLPRRSITTKKDGVTRVSCVGACAIEARCAFREETTCVKESCDGEVRRVTRADFCLDTARDCAEAARCPCEEACWKRGECAGDHASDASCTAACLTLTEQKPAALYLENRCVLESECALIPACAR